MAAMTARIRVRITPRAGRDAVAGWRDDVLLVRVSAPPVEGEANAALERLLAKALGLRKNAVHVVAGLKSREKTVAIDGLDEAEAQRRLREIAPP
jgi:uncharacterized protein (TIGR00251 family)